jgi:hypothetical protein
LSRAFFANGFPMKSNKRILAIALVAVAVVLFWWRQLSGPTVNLRPTAAVGEVLAGEVGRLLGGRGTVVLLSRQPPEDGPNANRERIEAFASAMKRRTTMTLAPTEWLPRAPLGTMDLGVVSPEQILAALEKNPSANAFVIFSGLPPYSPLLAEKVAARSLILMAVCSYNAEVRRWIESKALAVAVVPRFDDPPTRKRAPKSAPEWFEREFQLVTIETIARLPY